jgi:bifunctional DNA-binding transcriptional regulator/antitoxin component of YhaV-PrlF toxin-antitoxin module
MTVDKAGRIVLAKPVRDELQRQAGDSLELARCAIKAQADLIYT